MSGKCNFKCLTNNGYIIKVIEEILQHVKNGNMFFGKDGIRIEGSDNNELEKSTRLFYTFLPYENFDTYKCREEISLNINFLHLYNLTRNIRKKDKIYLSIFDNNDVLNVKKIMIGEEEEKATENSIIFKRIQIVKTSLPEGYYSLPISISGKEFAKIKGLSKMHDNMKITFKKIKRKTKADFKCDKGVYNSTVTFGATKVDEDDSDSEDEDEDNENIQNYNSEHIIGLVKLASVSENVKIYLEEGFPLKIIMKHLLGETIVFIKNKEMQEKEN
jgi:hypothetical protein